MRWYRGERIWFRGRRFEITLLGSVWVDIRDVETGRYKTVRRSALEEAETPEERQWKRQHEEQEARAQYRGPSLLQRQEQLPPPRRPPEREVTAEEFLHFVYKRPTRSLFGRKPSRKRR